MTLYFCLPALSHLSSYSLWSAVSPFKLTTVTTEAAEEVVVIAEDIAEVIVEVTAVKAVIVSLLPPEQPIAPA